MQRGIQCNQGDSLVLHHKSSCKKLLCTAAERWLLTQGLPQRTSPHTSGPNWPMCCLLTSLASPAQHPHRSPKPPRLP